MKIAVKTILPLLLAFIPFSLNAVEFTTGIEIGNMAFNKDILSAVPDFQWGMNNRIEYQTDKQLLLSGSLIKDDIGGNRIDTTLSFSTPWAGISLGPSFASFNNGQIQVKPGINGGFFLQKKGYISFQTGMYTTLGQLASPEYDYTQNRMDIRLSVNIPSAVASIFLSRSSFSRFSGDSLYKTTDIRSLYQLETDLFRVHIPFHLLITLGYRSIERLFPENDPSGRDSAGIGSAVIGTGVLINIKEKMDIKLMIDSSLYSFPLGDTVSSSDIPNYLFEIKTSFTYH